MEIKLNKNILTFSLVTLLSIGANAQDEVSVIGKVVDAEGNPIVGAAVMVEGTSIGTVTDAEGTYSIKAPQGFKINYSCIGYDKQQTEVGSDTYDVTLNENSSSNKFTEQTIAIGAYKNFSRSESTSAVSVITNETIDDRSERNIANSVIGQGTGVVMLDQASVAYKKNPSFWIRGLHSYVNYASMVLVDGVERDITLISPQEVESVSILKDAAAAALYGYRGIQGVISITTKRGKTNGKHINVSYDYGITTEQDRPDFVDSYTYANARNEALAMEGGTPEYDEFALEAYKTGKYPDYYPNVDWAKETLRKHGHTNRLMVDFNGGSDKFHYYTMVNLYSNKGFIKNHDANEGYDTQEWYSRANLRNNLDINVTNFTKLQVNIGCVLSEIQYPGNQLLMWPLIYDTPSLAFPVKNTNGTWGGNTTWSGILNPVAQSQGAGYYKYHERSLTADVRLDQSLSMFVEGLGFAGRFGFDSFSRLTENHSKVFEYGYIKTSVDTNGELVIGDYDNCDSSTGELGSASENSSWYRIGFFEGGLTFDRHLNDDNYLYAQAKYDYRYENSTGVNTTINRQNFSWYSHYGLMNKYYIDLAFVGSESSRLAPNHKWAFSPTISAAWVLSNEDFLQNIDFINFAKLRASFGKINADFLPDDSWTYYTQQYVRDGVTYPFDNSFQSTGNGRTTLSRLGTEDPTTEKALIFNVGFDATLFNDLNVEFDYFKQKNKDIWVDGSNVYSAVVGFESPYVNKGECESWGYELALDYTHSLGDLTINVGGTFNNFGSKSIEMGEAPQAYENLVQTGRSLNSKSGLIAIGLFRDQADIDNSPEQKFTTTRPGDIKYKDINGDNVIDANDYCEIADDLIFPAIYYSFHLGAEYKGIGFKAMFQGTGKFSAMLKDSQYYMGLADNTALTQERYDNRWTPNNLDAKYPRLSSVYNDNNDRPSTFWIEDRSFLKLRNIELYYNFPKNILDKTFIENAKVFVRGVDLFTFDKIDNRDAAVFNATTPSTCSVSAGFSLTF